MSLLCSNPSSVFSPHSVWEPESSYHLLGSTRTWLPPHCPAHCCPLCLLACGPPWCPFNVPGELLPLGVCLFGLEWSSLVSHPSRSLPPITFSMRSSLSNKESTKCVSVPPPSRWYFCDHLSCFCFYSFLSFSLLEYEFKGDKDDYRRFSFASLRCILSSSEFLAHSQWPINIWVLHAKYPDCSLLWLMNW